MDRERAPQNPRRSRKLSFSRRPCARCRRPAASRLSRCLKSTRRATAPAAGPRHRGRGKENSATGGRAGGGEDRAERHVPRQGDDDREEPHHDGGGPWSEDEERSRRGRHAPCLRENGRTPGKRDRARPRRAAAARYRGSPVIASIANTAAAPAGDVREPTIRPLSSRGCARHWWRRRCADPSCPDVLARDQAHDDDRERRPNRGDKRGGRTARASFFRSSVPPAFRRRPGATPSSALERGRDGPSRMSARSRGQPGPRHRRGPRDGDPDGPDRLLRRPATGTQRFRWRKSRNRSPNQARAAERHLDRRLLGDGASAKRASRRRRRARRISASLA